MSIVSVDNIQPIGSGTSVTVNKSVTLESGNTNITGVCTATSFSGSGANLTSLPAGNLTGTLPAISGANLTSLPAQATISNNADNRVITGGSGVNLYAESGFTYDGTTVQVPDRINYNTNGTYLKENQLQFKPSGTSYIDHGTTGQDIQIRMSTSSSLDTTGPTFKSNGNLAFASGKGIDFSAQSTSAQQNSPTVDDEVLQHYEKGKWTPDVRKNGVSNATPDIVHGRYVRIGQMVWLSMYARWASGSNAQGTSGSWEIYGLPFSLQDDNPGTCRIYSLLQQGIFILIVTIMVIQM